MNAHPGTPRQAGFAMPAEWEPHAGCLMTWPSRAELWGETLPAAKRDYAEVAQAIASFEPLWMLCNPGREAEVAAMCGTGVTPLPIPVDDSWIRDNGPTFVKNGNDEVAAVNFEFNAWGNRWHPHHNDNAAPTAIAQHLGMTVFDAPLVMEGGAYFTDGEGTLITTEQCLLNPNRNPSLSKDQIEQYLRDYLGVSKIIWLKYGHSTDVGPAGTDGHIDGVLQYVAPGHVLVEAPSDRSDAEFERSQSNLAALRATTDAAGRTFEISILDPGPSSDLSYSNYYLANGGVVVPVSGHAPDDDALALIGSLYPDRKVVGVPGRTLAFGGGGPHCITQQIPLGPAAAQ
jgi:agmatine deiminase